LDPDWFVSVNSTTVLSIREFSSVDHRIKSVEDSTTYRFPGCPINRNANRTALGDLPATVIFTPGG